MLETVKNAFRIKDIRKKLFYTFMMLIVIRLGSQLPVPGTVKGFFSDWFSKQSGDFSGFLNAFTGGSFERMSVFALNITPYITSSIIMQLLTIAIPKLEELQKDGEDGRKKIASITRYVTVGLALFESTAMAIGFGNQGLISKTDGLYGLHVVTVIAGLTAGSAFLMWIGEQINENGIGNGISIVLTINIISSMPQDFTALYQQFVKGKSFATGALAFVIMIAIVLGTIILTVILNGGERRIPVQYAKKIQGRKTYGGQSSNIPLKVNTSGVIPIIFASSIMQLPVVISSFTQVRSQGFAKFVQIMSSSYWFKTADWFPTIGALIYVVLVIFFAYFYTSITFNPLEIADNMKKQGGFIPGIRPGKPTSEYLSKILNYVIFIGAVGLIIVAMVPIVCNGLFGASVSFGGTSLIIIVSVILETLKQVESQMLVRNYKGFLSE